MAVMGGATVVSAVDDADLAFDVPTRDLMTMLPMFSNVHDADPCLFPCM